MPDDETNRAKMAQFVAQEIVMDRRIPHASKDAVEAIIKESRRRAKDQEGKSRSLTLRLREMGGLIRSAGDVVVNEGGDLIEASHIAKAVKIARTAEEQIKDRYGSFEGGLSKDLTAAQQAAAPYQYWNYHESEDERYIG